MLVVLRMWSFDCSGLPYDIDEEEDQDDDDEEFDYDNKDQQMKPDAKAGTKHWMSFLI